MQNKGQILILKEYAPCCLSNLFFSSTSLSLKTPFVDAKTEKRGLQRKVSNRRKISEEEFGTAVDKRQMGGKYLESKYSLQSSNGT